MGTNQEFRLILASSSPRRRELLGLLGLPFTVQVSGIDETPHLDETPLDYVRRVANEKAAAVVQSLPSDEQNGLLISSDTDVVFEDEVFGKPHNSQEAVTMLERLRGKTHEVITAVTVLNLQTGETQQDVCRSPVPIRDYSDEELNAYVASGDPLDKAGAYAIHHTGFHPVENFSHCFASVMGLPLCHLTRTLRHMGVEPATDVPVACQTHIKYNCPVYRDILNDAETH
jgi:septum formation protein